MKKVASEATVTTAEGRMEASDDVKDGNIETGSDGESNRTSTGAARLALERGSRVELPRSPGQ